MQDPWSKKTPSHQVVDQTIGSDDPMLTPVLGFWAWIQIQANSTSVPLTPGRIPMDSPK